MKWRVQSIGSAGSCTARGNLSKRVESVRLRNLVMSPTGSRTIGEQVVLYQDVFNFLHALLPYSQAIFAVTLAYGTTKQIVN